MCGPPKRFITGGTILWPTWSLKLDAPVSVGLRAWSPFIPGDTAASNIPATVFEVHLRNTSEAAQKGTLAFNFPGPDAQEALSTEFTRQEINEDFRGVFVASQGGVNYLLGVMGPDNLRLGAGLNSNATAWSKIATELPQPSPREWGGVRVYTDPSSSAAVDFSLAPGQSTVVRFLLAWYAPVWQGAYKPAVDGGKYYDDQKWLAPAWMGDTIYYTEMYAARYGSALDVARRMAVEHAIAAAARAGLAERRLFARKLAGVVARQPGEQLVPDYRSELLGAGQASPGRLCLSRGSFRLDREPPRQPGRGKYSL